MRPEPDDRGLDTAASMTGVLDVGITRKGVIAPVGIAITSATTAMQSASDQADADLWTAARDPLLQFLACVLCKFSAR